MCTYNKSHHQHQSYLNNRRLKCKLSPQKNANPGSTQHTGKQIKLMNNINFTTCYAQNILIYSFYSINLFERLKNLIWSRKSTNIFRHKIKIIIGHRVTKVLDENMDMEIWLLFSNKRVTFCEYMTLYNHTTNYTNILHRVSHHPYPNSYHHLY